MASVEAKANDNMARAGGLQSCYHTSMDSIVHCGLALRDHQLITLAVLTLDIYLFQLPPFFSALNNLNILCARNFVPTSMCSA